VTDEPTHAYDVVSSQPVFQGRIWKVRTDVVAMPDGETSPRDVVQHPGAVGVVAVRGKAPAYEVLLVNQYRHPVERRLDELPAGLLDVDGEPALDAVQRELAEEAGYRAARWNVLIDALTSPGFTDEAIRIFLARDLTPCEREVQEHEEVEMSARWVPLAEAVDDALAGRLENATAVIGVLAAAQALATGATLRSPDAAWRSRPAAAPGN
jgi:8-oxo-dGDP phosphatase